jgi:cardiolipin synthase A/B
MNTATEPSASPPGSVGPAADRDRYITLVEAATGTPFRPGNSFTILQNGAEIFPAMLEGIRSAKSSIEFVTFVYWRSRIANEFANALAERARAGVEVRLLVDAVGGAIMNTRNVWELERAGVKVAWFRPARWQYLRKLNNRTHRKVLVIDGTLGFVGGVGIADEWTGNADSRRHWRETHTCVAGPACADLQASFAESWLEATRERLKPLPAIAPAGDIAVHTTSSTAGTRPTAIERLFLGVIAAARRRLWITTAYFVPNEHFMAALSAAVARGVDVRILTNGSLSNHRVTHLAGRASYQRLLGAGVRIFEYQGTVLHPKVITADSAWATIGSTNLDDRSLILNDEINVSVVDPGLIAALDRQFETDLARAREVQGLRWAARGWPSRLAESGAGLFRHQL